MKLAPITGFTSGTSLGKPKPISYWQTDTTNKQQFIRDYAHMGLREGDHVLVMGLSFRGGVIALKSYCDMGAIPIIFQHHPKYIPLVIEAIRKYRPRVFSHLSNPMIMMFENYFEKSGEDPVEVFSCFESVLTGGEHLSDRYKNLIASWGIDLYQCTTVGDLYTVYDCKEHRGFKIHEDLLSVDVIVEGDDPDVGEMIVTTKGESPEPYVEFKTGDVVRLDRTPCSCGSSLHFTILGRKAYQIMFKGKAIYPLDVQRVIENIPETRAGLFQIVRPTQDAEELTIIVGYEGDSFLKINDVSKNIRNALEVPVDVQFKPASELLKLGPPHKIPRVI